MRFCKPLVAGSDPAPGTNHRSLELIGHLLQPGLGAGFVLLLAWSAAHPDSTYGILADLDRNAAAERDHIGQASLPEQVGARRGALRPFHAWPAESDRGIGLPTRQFDIGEARPVAL